MKPFTFQAPPTLVCLGPAPMEKTVSQLVSGYGAKDPFLGRLTRRELTWG